MTHAAHDYKQLMARWRRLARQAGLVFHTFAQESGYPVFYLKSRALKKTGGYYFSAGIHGDEAAATEGLIGWAEAHATELNRLPLLMFPCLNPWGLVHNSRLDEAGRDLNRMFHNDESGVIQALKKIIQPYRFHFAMMLHEDYDAPGVYLYELERARPFWGEALLAAAGRFLPIDARTRIEGRKAVGGLVRRKIAPKRFEKIGFPEAIYLHLHHAERTFTVETPSEFALGQRIQAQIAMIEGCVHVGDDVPDILPK